MRCLYSIMVLLMFGLTGSSALLATEKTPLDEYVNQPDPAFAWELVRTIPGEGQTTFVVRLTSQRWLTKKEVDRPLWEHWLTIIRPDEVKHETAFLYIGGGSNGNDGPTKPNPVMLGVARVTNTVVVELGQIPNQPLTFHDDKVARKEDNLIGYGWAEFIKTGDPIWLARLPMVKATVRAMDTVQKFLASEEGGELTIEKFVVAGGSKRGWTTWLTGAVDQRVAAIVPIVIDIVNVTPSMGNHVRGYGFWATAVGNYYQHGIMSQNGTDRLNALHKIVDPYYYLDRLTLPKYVVNASGDEFFTPDSSQFYYDELKGPKLLRYVPNVGHSMNSVDAVFSMTSFYQLILNDQKLPEYSWTFHDDGTIRVKSASKPKSVTLWYANNPDARDFRFTTIGAAYTAQDVKQDADGVYVAQVPAPEKGWTAAFVELSYDVGAPTPLKVSTSVRITPDRLPFADINPNTAPYELNLNQK